MRKRKEQERERDRDRKEREREPGGSNLSAQFSLNEKEQGEERVVGGRGTSRRRKKQKARG